MPESWLVSMAYSRHSAWAWHARQTALAVSICSMAGPVVPTGKKRSGSVSRQAASRRHSAEATVRDSRWLGLRATGGTSKGRRGRFVTPFTCVAPTFSGVRGG